MSNKKTSIADNVLGQIKKGEVKMKPGIYFTILSVASLVASIAAGIAMIYLSSIIFFWFKIANANGNAYGAKNNFAQSIGSFPWWTIIALIMSTIFIVFIMRRFGNAYRHKMRNIALIIIFLSLIMGFILASFGVGDLGHSTRNQRNGQIHNLW